MSEQDKILEALKTVTQSVSPEERQQWWDEATKKFLLARRMAEIGMTPYDPHAERVLRLLSELTRLGPEYLQLQEEAQEEAEADADPT